MASFRDSAPESFTRTIYRGSDYVTESTYRPETASDHLADSIYRPGTSSDQVDTSDSVAETKVPTRLKGPLKSRIISQLCEAEDFSADILHIPNQPARLVLQLGTQDATDQRHRDTSNNARQARKIAVRDLPPAAENEEYLDIFFESKKRQGGGPVKKVTLMKDKHSAVIEFENPDAVKRVLDKVPITMHDQVVDVEAMVTLLDDEEDIGSVQIKGLRDLADELRGSEVDGDTNEEAQTSDKTNIIYSGLEAAKVWHFCAKELENIVTNFDALVITDPTSGTPSLVTITAEKKFEDNIRKRLREVKKTLLSLQEVSVADTEVTSDIADDISNFNASNEHILLMGNVKKRKVLVIFDENFTPESAKESVRELIPQQNGDYKLPGPPVGGLDSVEHAHNLKRVKHAHNLKQEKVITAAIEIGELYSTYVYRFISEPLNNPNNMHVQSVWNGGQIHLVMTKIPTVVLFDERMKLHSAGFDAQEKYEELMIDSDKGEWHFFQRFTGFLIGTKVNSSIRIKDDKGRPFPAKDVITAIMRYLKESFIKALVKRHTGIENRDIHWVLIIQAHWSNSAKEFMRNSAKEIGIEDEQLSLVPKPTAISCYAHAYQNRESSREGSKGLKRKCMIVDLGDEVSSVTVLKGHGNGDQEELFKICSSSFCGLRITDEFFKFLEQLLGHETLAQVRNNYRRDFQHSKDEFKIKIRSFKSCQESRVTIRMPVVFEKCFVDSTGKSMHEAIKASGFKGMLTWRDDKLRCESRIFKTFFDKCCTELVGTIRKTMENPQLKDTGEIFMAGEFANSPFIQDVIKNAFPNKQVVIPNEPGFAALKGAVIYGQTPIEVSYRIPKYSYGIIGPTPINGMQQQQSDTAIHIYFPKGQTVRIGEIRSNPSYIETDRCREWQWKLFASERKFLSIVDDGCQFLGKITLTVPANDKPVRVDVDLMFGKNELIVEARDLKTGKSATTTTDILS